MERKYRTVEINGYGIDTLAEIMSKELGLAVEDNDSDWVLTRIEPFEKYGSMSLRLEYQDRDSYIDSITLKPEDYA